MTNVGIVKSVEGNIAKVFVGAGHGCCESRLRDSCDIETEAISLLTARVFPRKMEKKTEHKPVIESIIEE